MNWLGVWRRLPRSTERSVPSPFPCPPGRDASGPGQPRLDGRMWVAILIASGSGRDPWFEEPGAYTVRVLRLVRGWYGPSPFWYQPNRYEIHKDGLNTDEQ